MPCLSAYLRESLDFFKVGILAQIQTFGFFSPIPSDPASSILPSLPTVQPSVLPTSQLFLLLPYQPDSDAPSVSRSVPDTDTLHSGALSETSFTLFHISHM